MSKTVGRGRPGALKSDRRYPEHPVSHSKPLKTLSFFNIYALGASQEPAENFENLKQVMCLVTFSLEGVFEAPADHSQALMVNIVFLLIFTSHKRP